MSSQRLLAIRRQKAVLITVYFFAPKLYCKAVNCMHHQKKMDGNCIHTVLKAEEHFGSRPEKLTEVPKAAQSTLQLLVLKCGIWSFFNVFDNDNIIGANM